MIRCPELPLLPGNGFNRTVGQTQFHKSHHLDIGCGGEIAYISDSVRPGVGGAALPFSDASRYPSIYARGEVSELPSWIAFNKQCLCFDAYFQETVQEKEGYNHTIRKCKIYFFLEDGTIKVVEPKILNSGIPQGCLMARQRIRFPASSRSNDFYDIIDLNIGKQVEFFGRVFMITNCDPFTRNFLNRLGISIPDPINTPPDPYTVNREKVKLDQQAKKPNTRTDKLGQFLAMDGQLLCFTGIWDDRATEYGSLHRVELKYYLADDTIEVKDVTHSDERSLLLRRAKLSKEMKGLPMPGSEEPFTVLNVLGGPGKTRRVLDQLDCGRTDEPNYYMDRDLALGAVINVYGRRVILTDCDSFTKEYYRTKYGLVTLAMMTVGISVGWVSPALPKLLSRTDSPLNQTISHSQISWIASLHYFGMILSPLPTGWLMDRYGRKPTLLSLNCLAVASWVCIVWGRSTQLLYTARLLAGLWGGVAYTIIPVYIGEIADANIRGVLSTYMTLMKNFGNMFPYLIGPYISYTRLAILCSLFSFLFFVVSWLIPESPYYLLMRQRGDCAAKSLQWLRGKHFNISVELKEIDFSVQRQMSNKIHFWDIVATKGNRRALFLVEAMAVLQRMCGIGPLKAFGSISLPDLGLFGPDQCMMLLSVVWLIFTSLAVCLIDRIGRRVLLMVSCLGSAMAMFLAGVWYYLDAETIVDVQDYSWVPLVCLIMHGALAHMGLEPIGTMLAGELFPANVRSYASSVASLTIAASAFVANKTYLGIADAAGIQWDYWFYAADCLLALAFVATFLIETKGKTLQQIQDTLNEEKTNKQDLYIIKY